MRDQGAEHRDGQRAADLAARVEDPGGQAGLIGGDGVEQHDGQRGQREAKTKTGRHQRRGQQQPTP